MRHSEAPPSISLVWTFRYSFPIKMFEATQSLRYIWISTNTRTRSSSHCKLKRLLCRTPNNHLNVFFFNQVVKLWNALPSYQHFNPLMANDAVINGSTYLKKHNSLRKRSKRVKITKYVEQTLGKEFRLFRRAPCAKMYTRGGARGGCPPRGRVRKGAAPHPQRSACMASAWA